MGKKTAAATDVDALLDGDDAGGDDVLEAAPAKKAKKAKAAAAPAKKAKAAKGEAKPKKAKAERAPRGPSQVPEIEKVLRSLKRKPVSYADLAQRAGGADIRAVRRTARKLRNEGILEFVKEGTGISVMAAG
jgi:DNA-binding transcriptional ArsR family regulator